MGLLCRVVDLAPSSYYYHSYAPAAVKLRQAIEAIALEYPCYGYRRVTAELARRGWHVNHKRMLGLMREVCL